MFFGCYEGGMENEIEDIRDEIKAIESQDVDKLHPQDYARYHQLRVILEQMENESV